MSSTSALTRKVTMYFGLTRPTDQSIITDREWVSFLAARPYFESFTVVGGLGVWGGQQEPCKVLSVLCTVDDLPHTLGLARQLGLDYCYRFDQEAVLIEHQQTSGFLVTP